MPAYDQIDDKTIQHFIHISAGLRCMTAKLFSKDNILKVHLQLKISPNTESHFCPIISRNVLSNSISVGKSENECSEGDCM